ncbi:YfhO family protein [Isosphaeraceae bacterium EP7]
MDSAVPSPIPDVIEPTASPRWGLADLLALAVWTAAIVFFFWDVVRLSKALFYFDITEINYAYREFFARELKAGRFSRWCPDLYCGLPLFAESQAGYLHPLKYVLYPWMATWQAFNLDTVGSVWLTGLGAYGWLRRHVGAGGALAGAAVCGLGGFTWAHLIHTSMNNALTSVPFALWGLECAWSGGRLRGVALAGFALACQVFAGHLQDVILTSGLLTTYGLYRAATEVSWRPRAFVLGTLGLTIALGGLVSAIQWMPSKELLDRSPRAGGLTWDDLTYGSWHPELLPTLLVREAYGTRARDTDWMDGFYPYHEMNAYLGITAIMLAAVGAGRYKDRWVGFWVLLAGVSAMLMLGRFTFLFDLAHRIPIVGSSRIPVRFHLWMTMAVAALAAVGVDRVTRPGTVSLRGPIRLILLMVLASVPILLIVYSPVWTQPGRWAQEYHQARYRWLGRELIVGSLRSLTLASLGIAFAFAAIRSSRPGHRALVASFLPIVVIAELLGAHWNDVATVAPSYWTNPPATAQRLKADPTFIRLFGIAKLSAGEPGYASEPIDFFAVRDTLDWSLPTIWGLRSALGATPIIPKRLLDYMNQASKTGGRFILEGVTHWVTGRRQQNLPGPPEEVGTAFIYTNRFALPRARLMGRPVYAADIPSARAAMATLAIKVTDHLVVEDPDRPIREDQEASGRATIEVDLPERVEVSTASAGSAYLVLADTGDPGWSATLDGKPAPIRAAYLAFRAVAMPAGEHRVIFTYQPARWTEGLILTIGGLLTSLACLAWPRRLATPVPENADPGWPRSWPRLGLILMALIVLASAVQIGPDGRPKVHDRWAGSLHRFTWGAGLEAMKPPPPES